MPPDEPQSKQPRFKKGSRAWWSYNMARMSAQAFMEKPPVYGDGRRDQWLREFARKDPFLEGIVNSVVQIDRNRGWSLTGGRNQVLRFAPVFTQAEDGKGWRYFCGRAAADFYQTDMGTVVELGRLGTGGPLGAMWNVDSALCANTGKPDLPLKYNDQEWRPDEFFQVVPMPSSEETLNGLGRCAVSRCVELSRIMLGIILHSQEKLRARAKKGFLTIYPMSDEEWEKLETDAEKQLNNEGREAYGGLQILTSEDDEIKIALTSLSQLPDGFTMDVWVQVLMSGMSLAFGYDISEFYSPRSGGFSRGAESEVQAGKATGKGERDFSLGTEERIQNELPPTLDFEFDERNDEADLLIAELHEKLATVVEKLTKKPSPEDDSILTRDEARAYLIDHHLITKELEATIDNTEVTDTSTLRAQLRDQDYVHRIAERWPSEPIVRLEHRAGRVRTRVLFREAQDAVRRHSWPGASVNRATVYSKNGIKITTGDIDEAIEEAEAVNEDLAAMLQATVEEE